MLTECNCLEPVELCIKFACHQLGGEGGGRVYAASGHSQGCWQRATMWSLLVELCTKVACYHPLGWGKSCTKAQSGMLTKVQLLGAGLLEKLWVKVACQCMLITPGTGWAQTDYLLQITNGVLYRCATSALWLHYTFYSMYFQHFLCWPPCFYHGVLVDGDNDVADVK
jgi:hypothetical protein